MDKTKIIAELRRFLMWHQIDYIKDWPVAALSAVLTWCRWNGTAAAGRIVFTKPSLWT